MAYSKYWINFLVLSKYWINFYSIQYFEYVLILHRKNSKTEVLLLLREHENIIYVMTNKNI